MPWTDVHSGLVTLTEAIRTFGVVVSVFSAIGAVLLVAFDRARLVMVPFSLWTLGFLASLAGVAVGDPLSLVVVLAAGAISHAACVNLSRSNEVA